MLKMSQKKSFSATFKGLFEKERDQLRCSDATWGQRSVPTSQISNIVANEALGIARAPKTLKRTFCLAKKSTLRWGLKGAHFLSEENVRLSVLGARAMPNASFATIFEIWGFRTPLWPHVALEHRNLSRSFSKRPLKVSENEFFARDREYKGDRGRKGDFW